MAEAAATLSVRAPSGVIGVGNIGKAVTRRGPQLWNEGSGNDIVEIDHVFVAETGIEMTDLRALLRDSDYVSVNCDLNPTSRRLMNASRLAP